MRSGLIYGFALVTAATIALIWQRARILMCAAGKAGLVTR